MHNFMYTTNAVRILQTKLENFANYLLIMGVILISNLLLCKGTLLEFTMPVFLYLTMTDH